MREFILVTIGFILGDAIGLGGIGDICSKVFNLF